MHHLWPVYHLISWVIARSIYVNKLCSMIRTLRTLIATTSELITLLKQHHETDLPLEADRRGQPHKWACFTGCLRWSMGHGGDTMSTSIFWLTW